MRRAGRYGLEIYEGFSFLATRREMRHKVYKYIYEGLYVRFISEFHNEHDTRLRERERERERERMY